jgi:pimeloyl-ACP methyl ester carboxylesterase
MTTPPRQGRHVVANGIRLHFVRLGNGRPPLILLPGITSPAVTWEFVAASLAARNDVYVLDNGTVSEADAEVFVTALRSGHKQRIDGAGQRRSFAKSQPDVEAGIRVVGIERVLIHCSPCGSAARSGRAPPGPAV